jgi:polyadenylate-binding protein
VLQFVSYYLRIQHVLVQQSSNTISQNQKKTKNNQNTSKNDSEIMAAQTQFTSASLYIGDLDHDVTEANLFEIFNTIGPVVSIRVCRDAITRRSLGYAYVNFHNVADAERAIDSLNNSPIKSKPCRIMWSQRDPSLRKSGKGNIFIKNLDKSIDHKALYDTFAQFGPIVSCKIELDENNESKGYGYIQFSSQEAAELAIAKVNGMMLNQKKVFVGPFVPRKERQASEQAKLFTNVYVKNLPEEIDEDKLREKFQEFGTIKSAVIMKDASGKSKGFGFIDFGAPEEAALAVEKMNNSDLNGKTIYVGRAQKKHERESELRHKFEAIKLEQMTKYQGVNLYIKNLDDDFDDEKLRSVFTPFGTITSAKVMNDNKGHSKGFGFVCYTTPEEATKAVTEMNGKIVGSKPLYVALAQRKEMRRAQLEQQFAQRNKMIPGPRGMPMPMYANGAPPMFYPQPGAPGFVYPPILPAAARGARFPGPYGQSMPPGNYVMVQPGGGRGGMQGVKNNGRGMMMQGGPRRGGMKQPQIPAGAPAGIPVPTSPTVIPAHVAKDAQVVITPNTPLTPSMLASFPVEEQKRLLGEKLYVLIAKTQPALAGKITGMILDSSPVDDLFTLIDDSVSLNGKIDEALDVLREHDEKSRVDGQ